MKKRTLITLTLLCSLFALQAQSVKFGAKAGLNLANITGDFEDGKTRLGPHLGAVAEISVLDKLAIQPELLYSAQGSQSDLDDDDVLKIDYLNLPVMAKYFVTENLSLEAGPQIGFLLSAKYDDDGDEEDLKDITKSMDIGFGLGLSYKLPQGLFAGARYTFGGDINDIEGDSDSIKNSVFQISIGYFF